jgi:hypothetical protein
MFKRRKDSNPAQAGSADPVMPAGSNEMSEEGLRIAREIQMLPTMKCPRGVTEEILRLTVKQKEPGKSNSPTAWMTSWQFRTAVAGVAIAILSVIISHPAKQTTPPAASRQISEADAERAREQLKWSLAYTSQLLNKTEKEAISEAVINELPKTLRNTLKKTVPLFKGGES